MRAVRVRRAGLEDAERPATMHLRVWGAPFKNLSPPGAMAALNVSRRLSASQGTPVWRSIGWATRLPESRIGVARGALFVGPSWRADNVSMVWNDMAVDALVLGDVGGR